MLFPELEGHITAKADIYRDTLIISANGEQALTIRVSNAVFVTNNYSNPQCLKYVGKINYANYIADRVLNDEIQLSIVELSETSMAIYFEDSSFISFDYEVIE